jgi:hypothetical protein
MHEVEEYRVELSRVTVLELIIGSLCPTSVEKRLAPWLKRLRLR